MTQKKSTWRQSNPQDNDINTTTVVNDNAGLRALPKFLAEPATIALLFLCIFGGVSIFGNNVIDFVREPFVWPRLAQQDAIKPNTIIPYGVASEGISGWRPEGADMQCWQQNGYQEVLSVDYLRHEIKVRVVGETAKTYPQARLTYSVL